MRSGHTITSIAHEMQCTRAWIYLALKQADIDPLDFKWYRKEGLSIGARQAATLFASKHLKVRANGRTQLRILEEGRSPIKITVHTVMSPAATGPRARTLYYRINARRKGVVHVVPLEWETLVIAWHASDQVCIPASRAGTRKGNFILIGHLSDIDVLDVLRENIRY
jgi:hypothetical protein